VDLIVRKRREFSESEFARREAIGVGEFSFVIAGPEDVLSAELEWLKISLYVEKWVEAADLHEQFESARRKAR
jgi:hypothetical protein